MGLEYDKNKIEQDLRKKFLPYNAIFNLIQIGQSSVDNVEIPPISPPFAQTTWKALATHCSFTANQYNVYLGTLITDTLIEINTQTNLPTGNIKANTSGDVDYIPPVLNPTTCPTYQTEWIVDEDSAHCELNEGENTGYKIYDTLLERIIGTNNFTGQTRPNTQGNPDYVAPVQDPEMCPVNVEPPIQTFEPEWIGTSEYCVTEDIQLNEFDYLVLRYNWLQGAGTDLDIMVGYVNTGIADLDNDFVGWGQGDSKVLPGMAGPDSYLWWALDNTGLSGYEAVLINVKKAIAAYPNIAEIIEVELYVHWYAQVQTGDFSIEVTTYLGGTMEVSGTNLVNIGGQQVSSDVRNLNTLVQTNSADRENAHKIGVLKYNKTTDKAVLELI